ncbi:MAG TPA: hypothetical protein VL049_20830, partial [Candidatus Dormibacteraeota bacterium]|nr:hypothetical protein [Candidatus Dormibacteraeota bacterium]
DDPRDLGSPASIAINGRTTCGTFSAGGAACGDGGDNAPDAAFLYTAPAAGAYAVTATGLDFSPLLSVRDQTCAGAELACAADGASAAVTVTLAAGQQVVLAVDASAAASGDFSLAVQRLPTPTPTVTVTRTRTATRTVTATPTSTRTRTATPSATPSASATASATSTASVTAPPTGTATRSVTSTASATGTRTPTASATLPPTATATQTPTATLPPTPTATSSTVVIDFEILPAAGPGEPGAVLAGSQYADRGVTFNAPTGLDYDRGLAIPGFAHSGSKAVEPCYGGEFCTTPVEMSFAEPQQRVKLWVGFRLRLDAPREVVLLAFDAAGAEVARASGTLAVSGGPTPIRLPLEVLVSAPLIASAAVRFAAPTALTGGLAVDDVEFDAAGMAFCPSPRNPIISLGPHPSSVQTNQLLLSGAIDTLAPLESVTVEVTAASGGHALDLLASGAVERAGGDFGPLRLTGLLFPGHNVVAVTAADCHGHRSSVFTINYDPFDPVTRVELQHIEVTQSVQDDSNSVPLIADKRTLARVFLRTSDGRVIDNVSGTLTACHQLAEGLPICDQFLPSVYARAPITIDSASDLGTERADPDRSLDFELPADWVRTGRLHLALASLEIDGLPAEIPCDRCDNPNPFGFPGFHEFRNTKPVSFLLVEVKYSEGGMTYVPRPADVQHLQSWLRRAYPTNRVTAPGVTMRLSFFGVPGSKSVLNRLYLLKLATRVYNGLIGWWHGSVKPTGIYYALIYDGGKLDGKKPPYFVRGLAEDGRGVGVGPTGDPKGAGWGWDTDGTYGDWYAGHELGHLHGRNHPGFVDMMGRCVSGKQDDSGVDGDFPYAGGSAGEPSWDAGDASLGISARTMPPFTSAAVGGATDMMTYCNNEWISDYTYRAILHRLDPGAALVAGDGEPELAADGLVVSGSLNLTRDTVDLEPFLRLADAPMDGRPQSSPFTIDLRDEDGGLLASYPFAPDVGSDVPSGEDRIALISEVVPFDPATRAIEITHDGLVLGDRAVSAAAPTVQLLSPNGGETLAGPSALVTWQGDDADGDPLSYTLLYSIDGGESWVPIATGLAGESASIDLDDLPGSDTARLRIIASDGVNTAIDDSDGDFTVAAKPPEVRITAPAVTGPLSSRQTVVFAGEAFDREDGDLTGAALRWRSDRQGALGTGESIAVAGLVPGHHVV